MIKSMTGFGSQEREIAPFGKVCVELRSANHKFLEIALHLPEGYLFLEERIKKEIESKIKRGRVTGTVSISNAKSKSIFINRPLLDNYITVFKGIKGRYRLKDELSINSLINLPGILSLEENKILKTGIWPHLKTLVSRALEELLKMRQKEGEATYRHLKIRSQEIKLKLEGVKKQFKRIIKSRLKAINTDEERANFLKATDISEEIERLAFHIRNFQSKLTKSVPVGKELDFIAQEMQREANTMAAKSFAAAISGKVVEMKSQVEKIREQAQNIE